ncbi:hypothetical protein MFERI13461_00765 [Mycoplasma feriruminatoris]|uniref:ATP-binding cassette domain-containing protein n=1 Tax=Mycoplasma feriruminatoris TaxID=1179777 RepID=UPI00241ED9B6|nr:ABC transporter ATP-binding protein [Mycoplasma feriruminatoris]WFQ91327.1 hypothetical protein MFERI13461_00765 [Mycoplasma feriruminatoris]
MISIINSLINYAKNESNTFIKFVISYYLENNCEINEKQQKYLVESFFNESYVNKIYDFDSFLVSFNEKKDASKLIIEKLTHIYGCNAIIKNKYIDFCDGINIIYGVNGSGKSSYFRILKKAFSDQEIEILPNVYLGNSKDQRLDFNIDFISNGEKQRYEHQKREKIFNNNIIFFDSEKQNQIFKTIEKNKYAIYPNDFYLVKKLVDLLTNTIECIKNEIDKKKLTNTNNISSIFKEDMLKVENLWSWIVNSKDNDRIFSNELTQKYRLEEIIEIFSIFEYQNKSNDIFDSDDFINNLKQLNDYIKDTCLPLAEKFKNYFELVEKYSNLINKREKLLESINFLNSIEGYKTNEWEQFIKFGSKLTNKFAIYKNKCPYCQRQHDEYSSEFITRYGLFLDNVVQEDIDNTYKNIEGIIHYAKNASRKTLNDFLKFKINNDSILEFINIIQTNLLILSENSETFPKLSIDFVKLDKLKDDVILFTEKNKQSIFPNYVQAKKELELINKITDNTNLLSEWKQTNIKLDELRNIISKTTSKKLSDFFKKLYAEYFSNDFVNNFNYYMEIFDKKNDFLKFKKATAEKGEIKSSLLLDIEYNNVNVVQIFSEGEMKAIILSLIFAEIKTWNNKNPLIFDDPVTSFDNFMIEEFCNIVSNMDNQVIIFTHNMLLVELIKTYIQNKKYSLFTVQPLSGTQKGNIVKEMYNNVNSYLEKVSKQLKKTETINTEECSSYLRLAIESIIDEIVFNNQIPRKYTSKSIKPKINWDELVKMGIKKEEAEILKKYYSKVSENMHKGINSIIKPITYDDIEKIYNDLKKFVENRRANK